MSTSSLPIVCVGVLLISSVALACSTGGDENSQPISAQDSAATAREVQASLSGEVAPGAQAYSYRGLYAGIPRSRLETRTFHLARDSAPACQPSGTLHDELTCDYDVTLGSDSASVHVKAVFGADGPPPDGRVAREVTATRGLPLSVDGVRLARQLSAAFEKQTALLDKRDAVFGHHQAIVRMGTVNGSRLNYVDLNVEPRGGREILTVKMSRTGTAKPPAVTPPPKPPKSPPKSSPAKPASSKKAVPASKV
jgi:hypothetical protein